MGMNINKIREVVKAGQIATLQKHIKAWEIYSERTGETVDIIITDIKNQIKKIEAL